MEWKSPNNPPDDNRIILIIRYSPISGNRLKGIGYYEDGSFFNLEHHRVRAVYWQDYPEIPEE